MKKKLALILNLQPFPPDFLFAATNTPHNLQRIYESHNDKHIKKKKQEHTAYSAYMNVRKNKHIKNKNRDTTKVSRKT